MEQLKTGQIATIRNRLWRIDSIYKNELSATSIDSATNFQKRFYIPLENIQQASIDIPQFNKIGELAKQQLLINDNFDIVKKYTYKVTMESLNTLSKDNLIEKKIVTYKANGKNGGPRWRAFYRMNTQNRAYWNYLEMSRKYNHSFKYITDILNIL